MLAKRASVCDSAVETRIRLEVARRKNRRASISEQFSLPSAKTVRSEKLRQERHYAFLTRPENVHVIEEIAKRVRVLAEQDASTLGHVLSPMDKHRFHTWANELVAGLANFEPSDSHQNDPIVRLIEKLHFLHDGHVCLAEVAIDARQELEKWERAGVFDEEDDEGEEGDEVMVQHPQTTDWQAESRRKIESSYAFMCIRERAAARLIKRNTLRWVRSRAAFCSRVEELQVFGNTTAALMEELTALSPLQRNNRPRGGQEDLTELMKSGVRRMIDFKDLMKFSRHVALFTVDNAVRRVEELQNKRRLFELRCLVKLQTWWRKMHEVVKGRRMMQLLAEMKRKQEEEKRNKLLEEQQRLEEKKLANSKEKKAAGDGLAKLKPVKAATKSTKPATPSGGANSSFRAVGKATDEKDAGDKLSTGAKSSTKAAANAASNVAGRDSKAVAPAPPTTPRLGGPKGGRKATMVKREVEERLARAARAREARLRREFEEEMQRRMKEDEEAAKDTQDVEDAWRRFLESQKMEETQEEELLEDAGRLMTPSSERGTTPAHGEVDGWQAWSDDEEGSRGSTPPKPQRPSIKVVVKIKSNAQKRRMAESATASGEPQPPSKRTSVLEAVTAASAAAAARRRWISGGTQAPVRAPIALPGADKLNMVMPFADLFRPQESENAERVQLKSPGAATTRRRFHEIDFHAHSGGDRASPVELSLFHQPPVEPFEDDPGGKEAAANSSGTRSMSPTRLFTSLRASRAATIKTMLEKKTRQEGTTEALAQDNVQAREEDSIGEVSTGIKEKPTMPIVYRNHTSKREPSVPTSRVNVERGSTSTAYPRTPVLKFDFKKEDIVRRAAPPAQSKSAETTNTSSMAAPPTVSKPTVEISRPKFTSHGEWLRSIGVQREPGSAAPLRPMHQKTRASQANERVGASVVAVQMEEAQRKRRKRQETHALPLIGRHQKEKGSGDSSRREETTQVEKRMEQREILPPVASYTRTTETATAEVEVKRGRIASTKRVRIVESTQHEHEGEEREDDGDDHGGASEEEGKGYESSEGSDEGDQTQESEEEDEEEEEDIDTQGEGTEAEIPQRRRSSVRRRGSELEEEDETAEGDGEGSRDLDDKEAISPYGSARRSSVRKRRSLVESRRSRGELHTPRRSITKDEPSDNRPKRRRQCRARKQQEDTHSATDATSQRSPNASRRFRSHGPTLLQRIVAKDQRRECSPESYDDGDDEFLELIGDAPAPARREHDSDEDDEQAPTAAPDTERAAAFKQLFNQYMGLLQAAPPPILRV